MQLYIFTLSLAVLAMDPNRARAGNSPQSPSRQTRQRTPSPPKNRGSSPSKGRNSRSPSPSKNRAVGKSEGKQESNKFCYIMTENGHKGRIHEDYLKLSFKYEELKNEDCSLVIPGKNQDKQAVTLLHNLFTYEAYLNGYNPPNENFAWEGRPFRGSSNDEELFSSHRSNQEPLHFRLFSKNPVTEIAVLAKKWNLHQVFEMSKVEVLRSYNSRYDVRSLFTKLYKLRLLNPQVLDQLITRPVSASLNAHRQVTKGYLEDQICTDHETSEPADERSIANDGQFQEWQRVDGWLMHQRNSFCGNEKAVRRTNAHPHLGGGKPY